MTVHSTHGVHYCAGCMNGKVPQLQVVRFDLTLKSVRAGIMDSHEHGMQIHRVCWMPRRALLERLRALLLMVAVQLSILT